MGSIYKITNTVNGKAYIGQTIHDAVKGRIRVHLNGYSRGSELVKRTIEKYGKENFTYEILHDGVIPEFLDALEIEAIAKFNTIAPHGYNLTTGGEGGSHCAETCRKISEAKKGEKHPNYGKPRSAETRRRISESKKGKPRSEETKRKLSKAHTGKKHTQEHRRKNAESKKGKPLSPETCRKISDAQTGEKNHQYGKPLSPEHCKKISEAQETPERIAAREFFFSLPADMPLTEKRKHLRQKFPEKHYNTIYKWCKKFDSET